MAQAKSNSVQIAQRNLQIKNFETFLPFEEEPHPCFCATLPSTRPIFPDHLFVALDMSQDFWGQIHSLFGIAHIVKIGKSPAVVPTLLVTELMQRCDRKGLMRPVKPQRPIDHVSTTRMPFANFIAEVESTARDRRVCLLKKRITAPFPIVAPGNHLHLA
ncbi:transcription antitermination factor NusG [Loktanella sp. PT4BL]|uniref:transcription termination/antitermination NusG family protein n=1 Tax=Loktanella sp. PT4BL TaxID=2135611 RepID=UPI000D8855F3|nr:transcription termination/antitermination NusG family protein [Loktanella sp. PT4BL]PXW66253.1 transcription antitermination factor NusG [Loktanella sp. PT4BL]